jgi:two-component SAPR family response regulator
MLVIIIEPDHIVAKEMTRVFNDNGIKVKICPEAQTAISEIDSNKPSAIILELQLSGHSGVEFLHEFRSYEDWDNIPIFIYSRVPEYAIGLDQKIWDSYGVKRFFYKPKTSLNQLVGVVKGYLANA